VALIRLLHDACARIGLRRYELRLAHAGLLRTLVGEVVGDAADLGQVLEQLALLHQTGMLAARPPVGWLAVRAQRLRGFGERLRDLVLPGCAPGLAGACQDLEALATQTARDPQAPATADQTDVLWAAARALYKARWLGLEGLGEGACRVLDGLAALWGEPAAVRSCLVDLCGAAAGETFDRDLGDLLAAQQPPVQGVECLVAPAMLRGLGYYTGMMLEVHVPGLGEDSHVCGGGRYDDLLTSLGATPRPACGLGFGLEALMAALQVERQEDDHVQAS
jgi:ATP phosphoribosyltransferase regulatory subunit HisZ